MVHLTELPPEILQNILIHVDPPDLACAPRVCRVLYHVVSKNTSLFKQVYLRNLDTPPPDARPAMDWERAIKDLVRLQTVCRRASVGDKKGELSFVYDTVTSLLRNVGPGAAHGPSRNARLLEAMFSDGTNQAAFLCQSFIYERARGALRFPRFLTPPPAKHQMSAHLHCLYGVPILSAHPQGRHTGTSRMSVFACSKVYDLRQYTRKTMWGPFMADGSGRVDWEKVEAVMIAIGANLKQVGLSRLPICKKVWEEPFPGVWPDSYTPAIASSSPPSSATAGASAGSEAATDDVPSSHEGSELPDLDREDPYGISGTWLRIVCFLDYTDFFAYNFVTEEPPPANIPRPAIDAGEETRLILMQLHVTRIEPPGPTDGQALPVVYYEGIAGSLDGSGDPNASSDIRGTVRLTREGEVHWTSFSIFNGEERWRSEAIQVGGPRSAKGVLGNWFDKDFDPRGPAGPTAFWKVSDTVLRRDGGKNPNRSRMGDFMSIVGVGLGGDEDGSGDEDEDEELEGRIFEPTSLDV